jgi:hypothetical protein
MTNQRQRSRSGDPGKRARAVQVTPATGDERRAGIRAELAAIADARQRVNKQVQALRIRQYQAVLDGRVERMTWGEIAEPLKLAGPTVCGLRPPLGWVPGGKGRVT